MRDEQVRRYSRHILLPDVGGLGQTALLVATARLDLHESSPEAELVAATYLVAGGVGRLAIRGASEDQRAALAAHGSDTELVTDGTLDSGDVPDRSVELTLQPRPAWWPAGGDDGGALAFWRGGLAATRWMAAIANR